MEGDERALRAHSLGRLGAAHLASAFHHEVVQAPPQRIGQEADGVDPGFGHAPIVVRTAKQSGDRETAPRGLFATVMEFLCP
ncbi:hypothetical protein CDO52_04210 [Nocardiopsis gilva YIM 90087]|uniref:Uncharacterized protein n=1 Tax=Nocardiopsis gilva YIM 90087 TaxID=1235441 RepID=A0A223S1T3_9ACTN|nr:hypothetical protein CDO52_04210 [Nocardiopsis gilva YIM 90087]